MFGIRPNSGTFTFNFKDHYLFRKMNLLKLGKGMVMEMSNRKRSKSESKTGGKKEKGTMRAACFLPNM